MSFHAIRSIFCLNKTVTFIHKKPKRFSLKLGFGSPLFSSCNCERSGGERARSRAGATFFISLSKPNISTFRSKPKPKPSSEKNYFNCIARSTHFVITARISHNFFPARSYFSARKMSSTGIKQFNQKFLDAAAHGNFEELKALLETVDKDIKSDRGWTALMFAARNGHVPIISALIEKGCDMQSMNASGQTALEIAQFWNHKDAAALLSQHKENVLFNQTHNYFSVNPLYRASDLRKDESALQALKTNIKSKFVLFEEQKPFLLPPHGERRKYEFALFSCEQLSLNLVDKSTVIFLGLETWDPSSSAWFAINVKENAAEAASKVYSDGKFVIPFPVTMQMEETHAGIFAEAHSILCWLDRYKFCPTCGTQQKVAEGGYKQVCTNRDCSSHQGVHNTCYPRVDPSLIMLVVSPDKLMCLLGRQKRFPPKMYSCLAGFMEPGECIEDTCRREVEEESGVKVGRVDYHSSQPWPFPATLMLGCIAYARTDMITIDKEELEEARWFPRAEVAQMLAGQHPGGLFVPPKEAIAHQLIKTWLASSSSNL